MGEGFRETFGIRLEEGQTRRIQRSADGFCTPHAKDRGGESTVGSTH